MSACASILPTNTVQHVADWNPASLKALTGFVGPVKYGPESYTPRPTPNPSAREDHLAAGWSGHVLPQQDPSARLDDLGDGGWPEHIVVCDQEDQPHLCGSGSGSGRQVTWVLRE